MQYISSEGLLIDTVKNEARILGVTNTVSSNSVAFLGTNNNTSLSSVSFGGANNTLTDNAIVIGGANNFVEDALSFSSTNSKISSDSIDFNSNNLEAIDGSVSFRTNSTKLTASIGFQNSNDILNNNSIAFLSKNNNLDSSVLINGNNNILSLSSVNILTSNSNSNTNSVLFNSLSTNASLSAIGINANFSTIQNTSVGLNSLSGNITNKSIDIIGSNNSVNQNSVSINSDNSNVSNNSINIRDINNIVSNNSFSIGSSSSNINNSSEGVFVNRTTLNNNSFAVGGSANNVNINSFGLNSLSSNISNNSFAIGGSANNVSINSFGINLTGSTISNNSEALYAERTTVNNNSFAIGGSENNISINSFGINLTGSTISNNSEAFYTDRTTLNNNSFAIGGSANNININSIGINAVSSNVFNNSVSLYTNTNTVNLSSFAIGGINNNVNTNSIAINAVSSNVFNNSDAFYTDRTSLDNNSFAIGGSANNININSIGINSVSSNISNNSLNLYGISNISALTSISINGRNNNANTNSTSINSISSNIFHNSIGINSINSVLSSSSLGLNVSSNNIIANSFSINGFNSNITNNSLGINSNSSNLRLSSLGLNTFNSTVSSSFVYNTINVQALSSLVLNTTNSGVSSSVVIFGNSNTANNNSLVIEGDNNVVDNNSVILQSNTTNLSGNVFSTLTNSTTGRNNASIFNASNATVSSNAVLINGNNNSITNNSISIQGSSNTINLSSVGLATDNSRIINDSTSINTFNSTVSTKSLSLNTDSSTLIDRGIAINTFNSNVSTGSISLNTRGSTLQLSAVDILGNTNTVNNKGFAVNTSNSTVQNDGISFNTINSVVSGNSVVLGGNTNRSTDNSFVINSSGSNAFTNSVVIGGRAVTANLSSASINAFNTSIQGGNSLVLGGSGHNFNSTNSVYLGGQDNSSASIPGGSNTGNLSIVLGGRSNRTGSNSIIVGGNNNDAQNTSIILGGSGNNTAGFNNVVIIGRNNVTASQDGIVYLPEINALGNLTITGDVTATGTFTRVNTVTGSVSAIELSNFLYPIVPFTVNQGYIQNNDFDSARFSFYNNPRLGVGLHGVTINTFDRVADQALTIKGNVSSTGNMKLEGTLNIGSDVNLYRFSADTLKTDDNFIVGTLATGSTDNVVIRDGSNTLQTRQVNPRVWSTATTFASSTNTFVTNRILKAANTNDGITNSQVFDNGTNVGVGNDIPNEKLTVSGSISSTNAIKLAVGTTQDNGIQFGTDTNLFRSAADTLQTSDNFVVGTLATNTNSDSTIVENSGKLEKRAINTRIWDTSAPFVSATSANSFTTNTILKAGNGAGITNSIVTDNGTNVGISAATPNEKLTVSGNISGTNALLLSPGTTESNGIQFGTDTNLYRSAANTLQTDDELSITNAGGKDTLRITSTGTDTGITIGVDTNLYRSAADTLKTDDKLIVGTLDTNSSSNNVIVDNTSTVGKLDKRTINSRVWDTNATFLSGSSNFTQNYIPKASNATSLANSQIFDNATNVGINTVTPNERLTVSGSISSNQNVFATTQFIGPDNDSITVPTFSFNNDRNTGIYHPSEGIVAITNNGTEKLRVQDTDYLRIDAGSVGTTIGSIASGIRLRASSGNEEFLEISNVRNSGGGSWETAGWRLQQKVDNYWQSYIQFNGGNTAAPTGGISFGTGGSTLSSIDIPERLVITASGNVGIGLRTPSEKLTVVGGISASGRLVNAGMDCKGQMIFDSGTTVDNGIRFGSDVSLYRSAADTLRTDDNLVVATLATSTANAVVTHVAGQLQQRTINSRVWDTAATFLSGSGAFVTNYLPKATGSTSLDDSQIFDNGTGVGIGTATLGSNARLTVQGTVSAGNLNIVSNGAITFGTDVNLYRSANDTLRTDDQLHVNNMPTNNSSNNVIVNSSNILNTRTINSRVWDTAATFLSGSPTNNTLLKALGTNAVTNSNITEDVNNVIILGGSSSQFKNTNNDIRLYNGASDNFRLQHNGTGVLRFIYNDAAVPGFEINTINTNPFVSTHSHSLLVGTSTPSASYKFVVNGSAYISGTVVTSTTPGFSGLVAVVPGNTTAAGRVDFARTDGLRMGYLGGDSTGTNFLYLALERGAGCKFVAGTGTTQALVGINLLSTDTILAPLHIKVTSGDEALRIQGNANNNVGIRLQNLNMSTTVARLLYIDSINEVGVVGANITSTHNTDGSVNWQFGVTPAGDRNASRRQTAFWIDGSGAIHFPNETIEKIRFYTNYSVGVASSELQFSSGAHFGFRLNYGGSVLAYLYNTGEFRTKLHIRAGYSAGTITPSVESVVYAYGGTVDNFTYICGRATADSSAVIYAEVQNAGKFSVTATGAIQAVDITVNAISDISLKTNIRDVKSQWNDIKNIRIRNYNWNEKSKNDTTKDCIGVIAQEIEKVCPYVISETTLNERSTEKIKSVNYMLLYTKGLKALQEAMARIETLEAKVQTLENS